MIVKRPEVVFLTLAFTLAGLAGCGDHLNAPRTPQNNDEPLVIIEHPPSVSGMPRYSTVVVFEWRSGSETPPDRVRYLWNTITDTTGMYNPGFDIVTDINENPQHYTDWWSPWILFDAPGDSGVTTIIGDDEELETGKYYVFAVQAADDSGNVTFTFGTGTNVRLFRVQRSPGPLLTVIEPLLGGFRFIGTAQNPVTRKLPPGVPLNFQWRADAGSYSGEVAGYRYGWDVLDIDEWTAPYRLDNTAALEAVFHSGNHTLTIEANDLSGAVSRASIIVETVSFPMERNLLWIDDFVGGPVQSPLYEMPSEPNHDAFWLGICRRAAGFEPVHDEYDCYEHNNTPPGLETIGLYKNIIWTYSTSSRSWQSIVHFTPESLIGQGGQQQVNYLSLYLVKGGHIWTLGRADRKGGLAAVLDPAAQTFPMHLACEITGNRDDCDGDRSGVRSMPYRDYCISMLDKIDGIFRQSPGMPNRSLRRYDVMTYAYRDRSDVITARCTGLPERLDLREEVTAPGAYFDPDSLDGLGGFSYAEIFDPEYWMHEKSVPHQICFHPMYRMRARDPSSALDHCTIAIWITPYEEIVPEVTDGTAVAAPSVHFGFPLWFFEPHAADSIAAVVFSEWGIAADE
jgi:hypothetical protein